MSVLKKLASETALYGVSSILGRVIYWFLVPLHTYVFLRPGELSSNTELFSWVALFNVIYTFGMETAYFRFANRNPENQQAYFNQALTAISTISLVFSGALILLAPALSAWLNYPGEASNIVYLALIVAIDAIVAIPFARLRLEKKARLFVKIKIINILLNVALNVFFLLLCRDIALGKYLPALQPLGAFLYRPDIGPGYIFIANLIANAGFLVMLRGAFKGFRWTWGGEVWREMWVYAYPILILGLAGVANQMTDRWFLRHLLPQNFYPNLTPEDALGIYGNCYKLSVFMSLAIQSFKYAADPFFFSKAEDKNAPALLALVMKWFVIVCVVLWVGVSLNLDLLGRVMLSPAYRVGLVVVPILLLANLFVGVYYNWRGSDGFAQSLVDSADGLFGLCVGVFGVECSHVRDLLRLGREALSRTVSFGVGVGVHRQRGVADIFGFFCQNLQPLGISSVPFGVVFDVLTRHFGHRARFDTFAFSSKNQNFRINETR
jgi:O-antigen/teichoic acid export membrane protein